VLSRGPMGTRGRVGLLLAFLLVGCGAEPQGDGSASQAARVDGGLGAGDAGIDGSKAAACAAEFGTLLTAPYGRLDGTVLAVVEPGNPVCPRPNRSHVVLQVTAQGAPYRLVVNVMSTFDGVDPNVRHRVFSHGLPAPAWAEGWHPGVELDYPSALGVHSGDPEFVAYPMPELARRVVDVIPLGGHVSVYAATSGGDSAHKVHRNSNRADGAIVLEADGEAPRWLLFHFANQTF
jgi:hypothetical protein